MILSIRKNMGILIIGSHIDLRHCPSNILKMLLHEEYFFYDIFSETTYTLTITLKRLHALCWEVLMFDQRTLY